MILGIGIDILHLPRLVRLVQRQGNGIEKLAKRILAPKELHDFGNLNQEGKADEAKIRYLAVRWTAKEAAYKTLYPHYKPSWKDIQVLKEQDRKPIASFSAAGGRLDNVKLHLSVSHDGDYVASVMLAEQM